VNVRPSDIAEIEFSDIVDIELDIVRLTAEYTENAKASET